MDELFIDTSYLIAAVSSRDRNHAEAVALAPELDRRAAVTTMHVVGECWTFARRRFGHDAASRLVRALRQGDRYTVLRPAPVDEDAALDWLAERSEREYSFVDAVSFRVMQARGMADALAFDADFSAAGFRTLRVGAV